MIVLNLIALLLISAVVISFFDNKYVKIILSFSFALFFVMQLSSLYLGNSFIDYKYYVHFNLNSLEIAGGFKKEIILSFFSLIAIVVGLFFASKIHFSKIKKLNIAVKIIILVISSLVVILPENGICRKMKEIYDILTAITDNTYNDMAQKWGLTPKENLEASFGGKNIIIISLESFEKAFLHDANKKLTPNLRKRKQDWVYYAMNYNNGSSWTAGSLYTVFTGLPSFFCRTPKSIHGKCKIQ